MTKDEIQALVDAIACGDCFNDRQITLAMLEQLNSGITVNVSSSSSESVIGVTGGITPHVTASFTRPSDATQYDIGDNIANSQTAASVTPITFSNAARVVNGSGRVTGCRCVITPNGGNLAISNCAFDLLVFRPVTNIPFTTALYPADNAPMSIPATAMRELVAIFSFAASLWRNPAGGTTTGGPGGYQSAEISSGRAFAPFNLTGTGSQALVGVLQAQATWNPGAVDQRFDFALDIEGN